LCMCACGGSEKVSVGWGREWFIRSTHVQLRPPVWPHASFAQVLLVTHWFLAPIGVRRDGTMAGRWLRGGSAMSKWDAQRVERWAVGAGLSDAVLVNLRAARLDGKALLTLSHEDILKVGAVWGGCCSRDPCDPSCRKVCEPNYVVFPIPRSRGDACACAYVGGWCVVEVCVVGWGAVWSMRVMCVM
jgi:hypothetical protein